MRFSLCAHVVGKLPYGLLYFSYLADTEIGVSAVTDVLTFNISDKIGNVLPEQTLTVLIQPDNNLPPRVKVVSDLKVSGNNVFMCCFFSNVKGIWEK